MQQSAATPSTLTFVTPQSLRGPAAAGPSVPPKSAAAAGPAAAPSSSSAVGSSTCLAVGLTAGVAAVSRRRAGQRGSKMARKQAEQVVATETKKKYLAASLPDCPKTIWNADGLDLNALPPVGKTAPLVIDAKEQNLTSEYFSAERDNIMAQLQEHGAILFRNFDNTQDAAGFREFYESLQLNPCLDPIHTSGLREMDSKKDAVYEAVNKQSLAGHIVGLHNESTFVKTATYGAFVCFKPAEEGGGEFIIADGAKILEDIPADVRQRIYDRKVRISVSNLDLNFISALPDEGMQKGAKEWFQDFLLKAIAPKFEMDLEMIYGADGSNPYRIQAIEHEQSPINRHPVTGKPVWFCNIHNHSRYLRDRRPCTVPEVGMTDVYYGDLSKIPPEDVLAINAACEKNIVKVMMQKGDVILLDNYRVLHGRLTFKGDRKHAVTWFESQGEGNATTATDDKPDDFMNSLMSKTF
eukprot:CAMPEP_0178398596 /NCGR_PEP_ID=MMETSP0689_2-20121128/14854_1 /TAXON_ID=160604 /ORGANISM="Amphidinium massartii, Strain CS-259" /LENGTH=466 /DNA_ID=CAMNT_0020019363 /DNA_START=109 /DNA_END=1509 /DNA_ORIENTATION=-